MPLAVVRSGPPNREKPTEIVRGIDSRLAWAWDGLCFAVPFNDPTADAARDLVTSVGPSVSSGLAWGRDPRGNTVAALDATSYLDYPDTPFHNRPTTAFTAYVRFRRNATADIGGGVFGKRYTTGEPWMTWAIQASDADPERLGALLLIDGVWYYWTNVDFPITTTDWLSVFLRWRSGSPPTQDALGERGQILSSSFYASNITGSLTYGTSQPMRINGIDNAALNYAADYSQVMLWNRYLTGAELQALVSDPFGWYSPRRMTVGLSGPYALPFGGGEMRIASMGGGMM